MLSRISFGPRDRQVATAPEHHARHSTNCRSPGSGHYRDLGDGRISRSPCVRLSCSWRLGGGRVLGPVQNHVLSRYVGAVAMGLALMHHPHHLLNYGGLGYGKRSVALCHRHVYRVITRKNGEKAIVYSEMTTSRMMMWMFLALKLGGLLEYPRPRVVSSQILRLLVGMPSTHLGLAECAGYSLVECAPTEPLLYVPAFSLTYARSPPKLKGLVMRLSLKDLGVSVDLAVVCGLGA